VIHICLPAGIPADAGNEIFKGLHRLKLVKMNVMLGKRLSLRKALFCLMRPVNFSKKLVTAERVSKISMFDDIYCR